MLKERAEQRDIDALDATGELVIDSLQDARRMSDESIAGGAAQVRCTQTFEDFMRDPIRGREGKLQGGRIGNAGAVDV